MKILKTLLIAASLSFVPFAITYAQEVSVTDPAEALNSMIAARGFKVMGEWVVMSLALSQLLIFLVKKFDERTSDPKMKKYGTVLVTALSATSSFLGAKVGGLTWFESLTVFIAVGAPKFFNDMLDELFSSPEKQDPLAPKPPLN